MNLATIDDVIDLAIAAEIDAARTYRDLAGRVDHRELRDLLLAIAHEEEAHHASLERVREGDLSLFAEGSGEVELSAPLAPPDLDPEMTPVQFLLAAIDAERQAYQLYIDLARQADDLGLRTLLNALAREETNHWRKLEQAYDSAVAGGSGS